MKNELVSIIIPVYNVEHYLSKCIDSIINQTYPNIEVILIDDGSTDLSGKICDNYVEMDKRVSVTHKKNEGVSCARNDGIKKARGKYIFFIDSDDYLDVDAIEKMINETDYVDIVKIGYRVIKDEKIVKNFSDNGIFLNEEYVKKVLIGNIGGHSWGYLIKKNIIDNLFFDDKTSCMEDTIFITQCILRIDKIKCINSSFYNHVINENGITCSNKKIEKNIIDYMYSIEKISECIQERKIDIDENLSNKKLKIIESEVSKVTSFYECKKILENEKIKKYIMQIIKDIKIPNRYKFFVYAIIHKNVFFMYIYCNIRRIVKKIMKKS